MECCGPNAVRLLLIIATMAAPPSKAMAWGDDGHKAVALIAEHYLTPDVKRQVDSLLAADTDNVTRHDIADAATWADRYRDANHRRDNYEATKRWHYVDLEIDDPDINAACYGRRPLAADTPASLGDKNACVVDKINQFGAELAAPATDFEERILALKFLLHFVGDMHQPLHAADHGDAGGNKVLVAADGFSHKSRDNLHGFWDTQFVDALGRPPAALAKQLLAQITPDQETEWKQGTPDDWAMESFSIAQVDVYGDPPLSKDAPQHLDAAYVERAERTVALQLSRAGVRLAAVLNRALGRQDVGGR
jgi:S1/P1 Nuclease